MIVTTQIPRPLIPAPTQELALPPVQILQLQLALTMMVTARQHVMQAMTMIARAFVATA
jgi:hypothetical protein